MLAGSAGQQYADNVLVNIDNDYELVTINRTESVAAAGLATPGGWGSVGLPFWGETVGLSKEALDGVSVG